MSHITNQDKFNIIQQHEEEKGREGQYAIKGQRTEINFIPSEGEILHTFIMRTAKAIEQLDSKAYQQHVEGNRMWFCHKNTMGCFICQHTQFLYILRNSFKALSEHHSLSDYKFKFGDKDQMETNNHPNWTIVPI